jgi:hypothetical protein
MSKEPSRFSGAWFGWWALGLLRLGLIAVALVFGPLLAGTAWDRSVHVTPDQVALHYLLISEGITHHHQAHLPAVTHSAGAVNGFQAAGAESGFGSSFPQMDGVSAAPPAPDLDSALNVSTPQPPASHVSEPEAPPPRTLVGPSLPAL